MRAIIAFLVAGLLLAADEWPQFRGNPQLTGVASGAVPATLKLLWTYEAVEPIESSAAIVGGTVYVGSQAAELLAIDLQTGKLKWKYKGQEGIGESSPAVHDGVVYIGDLSGIFHAVRAADGKGALDVQDRRRDQVIARGGRRQGFDRLVRRQSLLPLRERRQAALAIHYHQLCACHAGGLRGHCVHRRMRRGVSRDSDRGRQGSFSIRFGRIHGRVAGDAGPVGVLRHFQ